MEFVSKIILSILLGFLLIFGLIVLIVYAVDEEETQPSTNEETQPSTNEETTDESTSEETTDESTSEETTDESNQPSPSSTYSTEELDKKTLMTSDDMIYCLIKDNKDNKCEQTTAKDCLDNKYTPYLTLQNCNSALSN